MLNTELSAKVTWPNGVQLSGKVRLNYLADVDPWLVHLTFEVAQVVSSYEIDRGSLMQGAASLAVGGRWLTLAGAPIQVGRGGSYVRFRVTDTDSNTHADFDVDRRRLATFLSMTLDACSGKTEETAMAEYIDKALGELT